MQTHLEIMPYMSTRHTVFRSPVCGKSLKTEKGLRSHRIQNRRCSLADDEDPLFEAPNPSSNSLSGRVGAGREYFFELPNHLTSTPRHEVSYNVDNPLYDNGNDDVASILVNNPQVTTGDESPVGLLDNSPSRSFGNLSTTADVVGLSYEFDTTQGAIAGVQHHPTSFQQNNAEYAVSMMRQRITRQYGSDIGSVASSSGTATGDYRKAYMCPKRGRFMNEDESSEEEDGDVQGSSTRSTSTNGEDWDGDWLTDNMPQEFIPTVFDYRHAGNSNHTQLAVLGEDHDALVDNFEQAIQPSLAGLHHTVRRQIQLALQSETQRYGAHFVPNGDVVLLELQEMLDQVSAPHHMFEDILRWAIRSAPLTDNFSPRSFSAFRRKTFIKVLYRMTGSSPNDDQGITNAIIVMENNNHLAVALPYPSLQEGGGHEEPHFPNSSWHRGVSEAVALYDRTFLRSRATHPVVSFSFVRQLQELLDTEAYFKDTRLLQVNESCPWLPYHYDDSQPIDDLLSGNWYRATIISLGLDNLHSKEDWVSRGKPFCLPIMLYIDKTGTDAMCKYPLEPLLFTIGLFRRPMRVLNTSWRHLGFVPDLDNISKAQREDDLAGEQAKGRSCRNYHKVLDVLLSEINSIHTRQRNGAGEAGHVPIPLRLRIGAEKHLVQCYLPIACVLGDNKSNDFLCGKIGGHHLSHPRVCRSCDCSVMDSDQPIANNRANRCRFITEEEIVHTLSRVTVAKDVLREKGASATLAERDEEKLAMAELNEEHHRYYCRNSFHGLWFGFNPGGIHMATPTDLLHTVRLGAIQRVIDSMVDDLGRQGKAGLDNHINYLFCHTKCTGRKAFPRIHFPRGVTNLSNLQAKERVGVALAMLLFFITKEGGQIALRAYSRNMNREEAAEKLKYSKEMLETLLLFDAWAGNGPFWAFDNSDEMVEKYEKKISALIRNLVVNFPREEGNGWKLQKTHEMLHLPRYITMYGSPMNYDSGQGESALKQTAKKPARNAQKRSLEEFEEQVGRRIHEASLKRKARNLMTSLETCEVEAIRRVRHRCSTIDHPNDFVAFEGNGQSAAEAGGVTHTGSESYGIGGMSSRSFVVNNVKTVLQLRYFYLSIFQQAGKVQARIVQATKHTKTTILFPVVLQNAIARFVERVGFPVGLGEITINGFSEAARYRLSTRDPTSHVTERGWVKQMLIRTHFDYQGKGPWHDWVMTSWDDATTGGKSCEDDEPQSTLFPAKVLAIFYIAVPDEMLPVIQQSGAIEYVGKPLFLLHCCTKVGTMRNSTGSNSRSSKITEKYLLEYTRSAKPVFRVEPIDIVEKQCFCFQETPGLQETANTSQRTVRLLKDRRMEWGSMF